MKFQQLAGLLALASVVVADSHYLWGEDGMGKMVKRAAKKTTTSSTKKVTSSTAKTSSITTTSSSVKTSSTSTSTSTKSSSTSSTVLTTSSSTAVAVASSSTSSTSSSTSVVADASCTNGPLTRACWSNGYSIATDFDEKFPTTGNTVSYNLVITNTTCNPDGNGERICLLINNEYPGPVITANWGDNLEITVTNSMQDNGTSIHWHGVRQYHSAGSDGVNGVTECALAPGSTRTYNFQVTQFGTSWYHAHFSTQYGDGVMGTMVFNGPASSNYDIDLGPYVINEWYYQTAFQVLAETTANLNAGAGPPNANNVLINGTNMNAANTTGSYNQVSITTGKKYRLRLVNTCVDNFIRVSLDNHPFTVMTADFVPIKPFAAEYLLLAIGQRYDVVINANQTAGSYWFRAVTAADCLSGNDGTGLAIWTYSSVSQTTPTSTGYTMGDTCVEPSPLVPYWTQTVPSAAFQSQVNYLDVGLAPVDSVLTNGQNVIGWALNTSSMDVAWDNPTMSYVMSGNTTYPTDINLINIPNEGQWYYWVIQELANIPPPPHPIHLHGHDFFVLGAGSGTFDPSSDTSDLNFSTPPRRDTTILPSGGWLVIAFNANNPGTWMMHCHISWHISEGLGVQFLEAPSQMVLPDSTSYTDQCNAWKAYEPTMAYPKTDSGL